MIANMKNKTVFLSRRLFVSAVFSAGAVFAGEEVHSFYISNHDQSPSHRVIHPIVGKTNFVYDAKGALELIKGEAIAFLVRDCENVTIRNLRLDYARPMMTEAKIAGFEGGNTILEYDRARCPMIVKDSMLFKVGEGFTNQVRSCRLFDGETREQIPEAKDIFVAKNIFRELPDGKISVDFDMSKCGRGCKVGDIAVLRPNKRDFPAIVVYNSKNTVFEDVVVHDAKGMVLIAQRSDNVTWRGTGRAEDKTSGVYPRPGAYATSHADATHFSNVKGAVIVENSWFEGMMDDAINVHSTCLAITNVSGRTLKCRYMHHQAVGFEVFKPSETLRFMNGERLENGPEVKVAAVNMLNEREVEITIDRDVPAGWGVGDAVENADYQCAATFRNNIVRHNRARGTLFTTPKPVLVESNLFYKVTGAPLLFSGDNYYWYESGACRDVVIRGNVFSNCYTAAGGYSKGIISFYPVVRNPGIQQKYYHGNVIIEDNTFSGFDAPLLFALSVENLVWRNNRIDCRNTYAGWEEPAYIIRKCRNVTIDGVDRSADTRMDTARRVETEFSDGWSPCAGTTALRKRFALPAEAKGQSAFLDIDGAVCGLDVFLNGIRIGSCEGGDSSRVNLSFAVKDPGEENLIEIRPADPADRDCARTIAAMCRGLKLVRTAPVHVGFNGVSVTAKIASDGSAKVSADVKVKGPMPFVKSISPVPEAWGGDVRIENRVLGEDGMNIKKSVLGTPQSPHRYLLETKLFYVDRLVDVVTNSFVVMPTG